MNKIFYIAEIAINHNGDINITKKLNKDKIGFLEFNIDELGSRIIDINKNNF